MKKQLNTLFYVSLGLLVLSFFLLAMSQLAISDLSDLSWSQEKHLNEKKYIETEADIKKIKSLALSLSESSYSSDELRDYAMHKFQLMCVYFSLFSVFILFLTYRIRKNFLTSK